MFTASDARAARIEADRQQPENVRLATNHHMGIVEKLIRRRILEAAEDELTYRPASASAPASCGCNQELLNAALAQELRMRGFAVQERDGLIVINWQQALPQSAAPSLGADSVEVGTEDEPTGDASPSDASSGCEACETCCVS
ncbi:hypothetical protein JKP88DRAFT_273109 [Tribonema minus]|uniref:Uncharacterized protein n=1 Tax=Tribonema minus TaxID=303371 RepID=A0A836CGP5_9STRA|nr:hypothetical protein JKP88DRAFT_273109 [Tribonema minus]